MAKACAYSCHHCHDIELGELSELGEKDILIKWFGQWFFIQIIFEKKIISDLI